MGLKHWPGLGLALSPMKSCSSLENHPEGGTAAFPQVPGQEVASYFQMPPFSSDKWLPPIGTSIYITIFAYTCIHLKQLF